MKRRQILKLVGSAGAISLAGCSEQNQSSSSNTESTLLAQASVTFSENKDEVIVRLTAIQQADHIYVNSQDNNNWEDSSVKSQTNYKEELIGQYLYTQTESGTEIGGVGTTLTYNKDNTEGNITVRGVYNGEDSELQSYQFLPRGQEPE